MLESHQTLEGHILMGGKGTRLFLKETNTLDLNRNIVELEVFESRRLLRQKVIDMIHLAMSSTTSTEEIQELLCLYISKFGLQLSSQLLRSLHRDDPQVRHSIVRLLILLNDAQTIEPLLHISLDKRLPRSVRLSASLALAGMGATEEPKEHSKRTHLYAIS
jgi:HEAT repeat protein